jgi:hypothetical protein
MLDHYLLIAPDRREVDLSAPLFELCGKGIELPKLSGAKLHPELARSGH